MSIHVQDLFIYPIKSLGGIPISSGNALQRGFEFDRRWMLVDENGKFITQRVEHKLALLKTELFNDQILISHKHFPEICTKVNFSKSYESTLIVSLWNDSIECQHVSTELDNWFSNYLQKACKLVYMPENGHRPVETLHAANNEQVSFADAYPYLLIGQASLDDLNLRLQKPVPMNRFRPNIVVSCPQAYAEDTWAEIKIGEVHFKVAKPCSRCILTTVNQDTGEKGKEPLATLSKYRTVNNKIMFGQNLLALNEGLITIQDAVEVIRFK